jgi:cytochrome c2
MRRALCAAACMALACGVGCIAPTPAPNRHVSEQTHVSVAEHMVQYGCPTCHVIPGVPGAVGKVGPSLDQLAQRSYLAGTLPNTPVDLQHWIMHPQHYVPGTAMPEMNVSANDAAEFARYLEPAQ